MTYLLIVIVQYAINIGLMTGWDRNLWKDLNRDPPPDPWKWILCFVVSVLPILGPAIVIGCCWRDGLKFSYNFKTS